MRKNFGAKPFLYPQPVMVIASCDKDGTPDAMNAAWGGIAGGDKIFLCLSSNHKTVENILERKAFTVSVADEAHLVEADYVGLVSGNDVPDKLERSGFHVTRSEFVDAPVIDELGVQAGQLRPGLPLYAGPDRERRGGRSNPGRGGDDRPGQAEAHYL